jgi:hypothetical protein
MLGIQPPKIAYRPPGLEARSGIQLRPVRLTLRVQEGRALRSFREFASHLHLFATGAVARLATEVVAGAPFASRVRTEADKDPQDNLLSLKECP